MINKKNRLCKLLGKCNSFQQFLETVISRSSWFLAPYVSAGENVNRPWIENFWKSHKGV